MADWIGPAPILWSKRPVRTSPPGQATVLANRTASASQSSGQPPGQQEEGDVEQEPYSDDPARNRQKELQDLIVGAESAESILSTVRELDGAIVISTALHRLGKVGNAETHRDPRFANLLEKFRQRLPFFGARQLSNSLHGLGSLFYREKGQWVTMVNIQTQRRIRDFEPQHVSNTLWACARMQLQEPLMLRALLNRAIDDISRSCPLDVSIVTWACATLKFKDVEWLRTVVRSRLDFADFSPQNMSNFVWGLATLGFRSDNMVLAVGREAARKIQDFIPQELSNFCWALATMDLCDNLWLRAVGDEVERRGDELLTWDPQSLSNMMWAFATLSVKDDFLFQRLLRASVARIKDHDSQNVANSSWAAAMVIFRSSEWLDVAAALTVSHIDQSDPLHLAQLAFAFSRFVYTGEKFGFLPALMREALRRTEEFAPQSLLDVYDALVFFGLRGASLPPTHIERRIGGFYEDLVTRLETFAALNAKGKLSADQIAAYQKDIERRDIVSLGSHYSQDLLRRFGLLTSKDDPFIVDGRKQILTWRAQEVAKDPTSRTGFHRAQCAWQLGIKTDAAGKIADGIFESGEPTNGGPSQHGLVVCRLRHPREGDAEVQALCAALGTSLLRRGSQNAPGGLSLNLHLSDVPCVSCLGATLQFHFRFPGVLHVSFDRGREAAEDSVPIARPPPPPSKKGNPYPYAPVPEFYAKKTDGDGVDGKPEDRSMVRRNGKDCREVTSFYGSRGPQRNNGAAMGGEEAVLSKKLATTNGGNQQTYYFSASPEFFNSTDYGRDDSHDQ